MIFQQYYLKCLSHLSYLIGDETSGRAVVVDPQRDVAAYLHDAALHGLRIERVIETHCHADFVSGHLELAATGAIICYGKQASVDYPIERLRDGQRLDLGEVLLEIRATPGHTSESISIVIYEHRDDAEPYGVLTGDTLLVGDVGRPDLLSAEGLSHTELAAQLFWSVHTKLLTLPDRTRVFPAHGAGSACGRAVSTENSSSIGEQRRTNYALSLADEAEFVAAVTNGQPPAPPYFSFDARRNRERRPLLDESTTPPAMSFAELAGQRSNGAVVLDTREPADFAALHLRGSVNVGLARRFAEFAGNVLRPDQRILLVCPPNRAREAAVRLGRIGFDNVVGYLDDPVLAFIEHLDAVETSLRLTAAELAARRAERSDMVLVDVRNPGELVNGGIPGAIHIPLARLMQRADELDPTRATVVYCASGYRSMIAASWLSANGFADVSDLAGGYAGWVAAAAQPADLLTNHDDSEEKMMTLRLNETAPDFEAQTTEGPIRFHEWIGESWAVLFSHPKNYTPVCTTELAYMAKIKPEFDRRGVKIIGLSADPVDQHAGWATDIAATQGIAPNYPLIGDADLTVAKLYDMLPATTTAGPTQRTAADNQTVRNVFVIGPDRKIKLILVYPMTTGRNFDEVLRALDSLQLTATHKVATPANWQPGEDVIIATSVTDDEARRSYPDGWRAQLPYLRIVPQPKMHG